MTKRDAILDVMSLEEVREGLDEVRHPVDVAMYSIDNYFNFGSIIRTCHSFLVKSIIGVDIPKHYRKADMGTHKYEHVVKVTLADFLEIYKDRNIVAFERHNGIDSQDLRGFKYPDNPILFFGSEKSGCPEEILKVAHSVVSIPMFGVHNDLNVGVACGIALFHFIEQQGK